MWLINKTDKDVEMYISELKRFIVFKPGVPLNFDTKIGIKYKDKYTSVCACLTPEKFFKDRAMQRLIVRDAGIGDLLLLEPVIRALKESGNISITMASMYPEIYENHPAVDNNIELKCKEDLNNIDVKAFDYWDDLRSYSETSPNRDKEHRTEVYNEKFHLSLKDKEPRLYLDDKDKKPLKKKAGFQYIGLSMEASHNYRGFEKQKELIEHLLEDNHKNIIVLFGVKNTPDFNNRRLIDLRAKTTLKQTINYIKCLDYMISVDSGLMHVALALHIPTVCYFTIISPDLRLRYYTGKYKVITAALDCIGCGDKHMYKCKHEHPGIVDFSPPCMNVSMDLFSSAIKSMGSGEVKTYAPEKIKPKVNIIPHSKRKLVMPIITLNEEENLPRFIDQVINHPCIGDVIAIDGGSTDKTVEMLEKAGCNVYTHKYDKGYHDMQALQRNISCSFVRDGTNIIIMDIDECFSKELSDYLPELAYADYDYGVISRRTFDYYNDITEPEKQIKDYPDYQPRFYKWNRSFKFVGSPHHITYNTPSPVKINKDIIHFEKEGKDRAALEKDWSIMWEKSKEVYA